MVLGDWFGVIQGLFISKLFSYQSQISFRLEESPAGLRNLPMKAVP